MTDVGKMKLKQTNKAGLLGKVWPAQFFESLWNAIISKAQFASSLVTPQA
jgi:hypothetical protein